MAAVVLGGDTIGPERIFPNQTEDLGPHQGPTEGTGDWSSEEPEEEQEETGAGPAGYSYQPLNQDPEQEEVELAPVGEGEGGAADIQDRIQALGLHLPDPPLESEDEDEEGAAALSSHSSIPMDPEHVELVKRTLAGVSLPTPGVPAWAWEISMLSGKMWYRKPSKAGRHPLPGSNHRAARLPRLQARTSTGLTQVWFYHPPSRVLFHIKANQTSQRPTLFSSAYMGTLAQAQPTSACITLWRIKHPMYTAKSRTACAPEPGPALSVLAFLSAQRVQGRACPASA